MMDVNGILTVQTIVLAVIMILQTSKPEKCAVPVGVALIFPSGSHWNVWNKTLVPKTTEEMAVTGIREVRATSNLVVPMMMQILMLKLCVVHVVEAKTDQFDLLARNCFMPPCDFLELNSRIPKLQGHLLLQKSLQA